MATVVPDKRPAYYAGAVTINWSFELGVTEVAMNTNGIPPAISKYIAYDTLSPPNPFIAVTQDGRGNVVYDGGFPKFYNHKAPAETATTFGELNASFKYLYNALNFVANPDKVANGNRKVLLVGDSHSGSSYDVKGTASSDFRTSFERLAAIAGYDLTIKNGADYGGVIDARLDELDQYCCVIYMSSRHATWDVAISDSSASDMVSYRHQGNGLIFITDHGNSPVNLEDAYANSSGFFAGANRVITNFGAYFRGNINRSSVNVGFLRSTYGDHPLYNGMTDAEYISAGGSESEVVVTEVPTTSPTNIQPTVLDQPGQYEINFLTLDANGNAEAIRYAYTVGEGNFLYVGTFEGPRDSGLIETPQRRFDYPLINTKPSFGTLQGFIELAGFRIGEFSISEGETRYTWYAGETVGFAIEQAPVDFTLHVTTPVLYYIDLAIIGIPPATEKLTGVATPAGLTQVLTSYDYQHLSVYHRLGTYAAHANRVLPKRQREYLIDTARQLQVMKRYLFPNLEFDTYVYAGYTAFNNAKAGIPDAVPAVLVQESGSGAGLYVRSEAVWNRLYGVEGLRYLYDVNAVIRAVNTGLWYQLNTDNTFVAL